MEGFNQEGKGVKFDIKDHLLDLTKNQERDIRWSASKDDTLGEDIHTHRMIHGQGWGKVSDKSEEVISSIHRKIDDLKNLQNEIEDKNIDNSEIEAVVDTLRRECEHVILKLQNDLTEIYHPGNKKEKFDEIQLEKHLLDEVEKELIKIDAKRNELSDRYDAINAEIKNTEKILKSQRVELN